MSDGDAKVAERADWAAARVQYEQGGDSVAAIAAQLGVSVGALTEAATREAWTPHAATTRLLTVFRPNSLSVLKTVPPRTFQTVGVGVGGYSLEKVAGLVFPAAPAAKAGRR